MSAADSIPTFFESRIISASLNCSMLFNFAMGIYTMIYGGTMYLYLSRKPANIRRRTVLWAISVLYLFSFLTFLLQWYLLNSAFVINGDTRDSIFFATSFINPQWAWQLSVILLNSTLTVADGLLVWRCYQAWGQSLWALLVPSTLLLAEIGLMITSTVLNGIFGELTSDANVTLADNVTSALDFVSFGTTVTATCLIWYRIHSTLRLNGHSAKGPFTRILILIIESAAPYSVVLLLDAITFVVPEFNTEGTPVVEFDYYITTLLNIVAGIAPTIMVARLALAYEHRDAPSPPITHVSGLNFHPGVDSGSNNDIHTTGADFTSSVRTNGVGLTAAGQAEREEKQSWAGQAC